MRPTVKCGGLGCEAATKKVGPLTRQERPAMDMRVRGKRPHGQQKVGGPTLKTLCLGTVGVGNRSARQKVERCTHRAKSCRPPRFLAIGDFFCGFDSERPPFAGRFGLGACSERPWFSLFECSISPRPAAFCCGRCLVSQSLYDSFVRMPIASKRRLFPPLTAFFFPICCYSSTASFIRRSSL